MVNLPKEEKKRCESDQRPGVTAHVARPLRPLNSRLNDADRENRFPPKAARPILSRRSDERVGAPVVKDRFCITKIAEEGDARYLRDR